MQVSCLRRFLFGELMPNVSKYSPEKEAALIEALEELGGYGKAARRCRISAKTFQRWRMDYPEFGERCTAARDIGLSAGIDEVETKVFEVARNPKHPQFITAAIFLLKSHNRKVYGDKQQIEHSGAVTFADLAGIASADAESS